MKDFETYLSKLAKHEVEKSQNLLNDPRSQILVHAGVRLNWLGDFFANPNIIWNKQEFNINTIEFTGTSLAWNKILIDQCNRSPSKFIGLVNNNLELKKMFEQEASFDNEIPILVRKSSALNKYKVLDGMHRFVGSVLEGRAFVKAYFAENYDSELPWCEAHVVYDLIRGFMQNAQDKEGENDLYHGLKLLIRTYGNVRSLLTERFNQNYVSDQTVQKIITRVLRS